MSTWLVVDTSYLAYRAFHTFGGFRSGSIGTGVSYGVIRDVLRLMDQFATNRVAFCFDYGKPKRIDLYPDYKKKRNDRKQDPLLKEGFAEVRRQVDYLRNKLLHRLGFRNLYFQEGYEADDVIAAFCQNLWKDDDVVIISADKDLYQCLSSKVVMWDPKTKKCIDDKWFTDQFFGMSPSSWSKVKAIAGCSTDQVPQLVKGVGEQKAAKFVAGVRGHSLTDSVYYNQRYQSNLELVKLPFPGTEVPKRYKDKFNPVKWNQTLEKLGMKTLLGKCPYTTRIRS